MVTAFDLLYVLAFAVALPLYDLFVGWPSYARRVRLDAARARAWLWATNVAFLWGIVAVGAGHWWYAARPWSGLRLVAPTGWRLAVAVALVVAFSAYQVHCIVALLRDAALRERLRAMAAEVADVVPRSRSELPLFTAVSFTAGFGEEFLYRGYFPWALTPWLGWWGAAALSTVLFALAHAYQGWRGVIRTGLTGACFLAIVVLLDSLWPAIVLHALVDAFSGVMAYIGLRDAPPVAAPATR